MFARDELPPGLQKKLFVGSANDPLELEADRIADQVVRTDDSVSSVSSGTVGLQRKCGACLAKDAHHDEEPDELRRTPAGPELAHHADAPSNVQDVLRSPGHPLDESTADFMEARFGCSFSGVRVHSDSRAGESAKGVNALAYTIGHKIVFAPGRFAPSTSAGRRLLAHELAHVVQQRSAGAAGAPASGVLQREPSPPPIGQAGGGPADPELEPVLRAAARATKASGPAAMIAASEVVYRLIRLYLPNYAEAISGVGYDEKGEGIVARRAGAKGANIDVTVGRGFVSRIDPVTLPRLSIELRDALKSTGVSPSPPERIPKKQIGLLEDIRQANPPGFKEAKENHEAQQKRVVELIASARAVTRGNSAADTALQNSIEWIEPTKKENNQPVPAKFPLLILTPTHDSDRRKEDSVAYFDNRRPHPEIGGSDDPTGASDEGVDYQKKGILGQTHPVPGGARSAMQYFAVRMYVAETTPITMERLSETLIHETQHVADRVPGTSVGSGVAGIERMYQSEFNAYWIEAPVSEKDCIPAFGHCVDKNPQVQSPGGLQLFSSQKGFGSETNKAAPSKVVGSDIKQKADCKAALPGCQFESKEQPTKFQNEKQQKIFEHLIATYQSRLFDCFYVCNDKFKDMVDTLSGPVGVNLVNSIRIDELLDRVDVCDPKMAVDDPRMARVVDGIALLDGADMNFLRSSLASVPREAKEETARQAEEKKERAKQELRDAIGGGVGSKAEKHDAPVSFWLYLMRRLPAAGFKKVQEAVKATPATAAKR